MHECMHGYGWLWLVGHGLLVMVGWLYTSRILIGHSSSMAYCVMFIGALFPILINIFSKSTLKSQADITLGLVLVRAENKINSPLNVGRDSPD